MTQNLGSVDEPLKMAGEQWILETRTDDPSNPENGECWIREDLDDGDQLGALVFGNGNEVPLYDINTSEDTVSEALRVRVNGQTAYAPIAPVDDSNFFEFRMQHNGDIFGLHDSTSPGRVPDDGVTLDQVSSTAELSANVWRGVVFDTNFEREDLFVEGYVRSYKGALDRIRLTDINENVIDSFEFSSTLSGETFDHTFKNVNLSAETEYIIMGEADQDARYTSGEDSFRIEGGTVDAVAGWDGGSQITDNSFTFEYIE